MRALTLLAVTAAFNLGAMATAATPAATPFPTRTEALKACGTGKVVAIAGGKYTCEMKMGGAPVAAAPAGKHYATRADAIKACDKAEVTAIAGGKYACKPM